MDDWVVVEPQQQAARGGAKEEAKGGSDRAPPDDEGVEQVATRLETAGESPRRGVGEAVYDLRGVVNHYGGLNGGHYTAFALNEHDSRWYDFSDDRVSAVLNEENDLVTSAAYVLFYERRGASSRGGGGVCAASVCPSMDGDGVPEA